MAMEQSQQINLDDNNDENTPSIALATSITMATITDNKHNITSIAGEEQTEHSQEEIKNQTNINQSHADQPIKGTDDSNNNDEKSQEDEKREDPIHKFINRWNSEHSTDQLDYESFISLRDGNIITARKLEKVYGLIGVKNKDRRKNIMEAIYEKNPAHEAWLSLETTINEININDRYFTVEGWLVVFWQDEDFDTEDYLDKLSGNMDNYYNNKIIKMLLNGEDKKIKPQLLGNKDYTKKEIQKRLKVVETGDGFQIWSATNEKQEQKYIQMRELLIDSNTKYSLPFYLKKTNRGRKWAIFSNALEFDLLGTNPLSIHYNINNKVFKMHLHFKAKCYECFENNEADFPFEWQFLNMQMPYKIDKYAFKAKIPQFVKSAFCFPNYWMNHEIWERCVSVRMKDDVDHWKLLDPWVDLRRARDDYDYSFGFGLIKYRIRRDPTYYILNVIAPLFLMGICAFAVFMIDCDSDSSSDCSGRFSYIVALLLAVAAFQISVELSTYQSEFTLIDHYFLLAYVILTAFILEAVLVQAGWRWEIDPYIIDLWFCLVFAVIWLMYSFKFVFKYCIFAADIFECRNFTKRMCCDGIICCFGCTKSFGLCICVTLSCCKKAKRKERLKHWMRMEKAEAASWDNAKKLIETSRKAELVLGTKGDVYSWNQGTDHKEREQYLEYYESLDHDEGNQKIPVDLRIREEIITELLQEK